MSNNSKILILKLNLCMQSVRNSSLEKKKISSIIYKKKDEKKGLQAVIIKKELKKVK